MKEQTLQKMSQNVFQHPLYRNRNQNIKGQAREAKIVEPSKPSLGNPASSKLTQRPTQNPFNNVK